MNILMIGWGFPPNIQGGLDIHVYEICRELAKRNHISLVLPESNSPENPPKGINIIPIDCPSGKPLLITVREYNRNILKACKGMEFDVIHSHDWFGVECSQNLMEESGKPWVLTLHSLEYMRSCNPGKKSVMEILERRGAKKCSRIITVSRFMKNSISKEYAINPGKIDVIYNSARIGKGNPGKIRKGLDLGKSPLVLFLGRLSGQKGPEHFLCSAKKVLERIPEARFMVVGEGHLREGLERFSEHLGLEGKVIFTGFVEEKASYYSAADVFVLPSLSEPFGITVLEAVLSGTPAVVSENAGVLENLPEMGCIQKTRPADSGELADKIISILEKRERVSGSEMNLVMKAYSWEKISRETERVYKKVLPDQKVI